MEGKDSFIIDLKGFNDEAGRLVVKEIAVVSISKRYTDHWILEPPYWFFELTSLKRASCIWRTNAIHGIEWEQGDVPYNWVFDRLAHLARISRRIFAYGSENVLFLRGVMAIEILDLAEVIPSLNFLPKASEYCLYHGVVKKEQYSCALNVVMQIRDWILVQIPKEIEKLRMQENDQDEEPAREADHQSDPVIYDAPRRLDDEYVNMDGLHKKNKLDNAKSEEFLREALNLPPTPVEKPPPIPEERPGTPHPLEQPNSRWTSYMSSMTMESQDFLSDDGLASILDCPSLPDDMSSESTLITGTQKSTKKKLFKKRPNWKLSKVFLALTTLFWTTPTDSFIAYDCGSHNMNVTTVSLLDVGECDVPPIHVNVSTTHMQLLQLNDYSKTHVIQCKISVKRTIYHCGMHSHMSVVAFGEAEYVKEVGQEDCQLLHQTGILLITPRTQIAGIRHNDTTIESVILNGKIDANGNCIGTQYIDPYGEWDNVIVQGIIKVKLQDYWATVHLNTNKIHFLSGYTCPLSESKCIEPEGGNSFWSPLPTDSCDSTRYGVLYEGIASKIIDKQGNNLETIYSLTTDDVIFAVTKRGQKLICGYELVFTNHPKLFVLEGRQGNYFMKQQKISAENIDLLAYVNSKFVYVERHIRTEMNHLYRDMLLQKCNLEIQVLKNSLALAVLSPDEFAYQLMKGPGYMALVAGEVIHVVKCVPVDVVKRRTEECYHQVPVFKGDDSLFMTPKTHILMNTGTQITCNPIIPPMYRLNDAWYKMIPSPVESQAPPSLQPLYNVTWRYTSPGDLAKNGIYSTTEMDSLRQSIMFPQERASVLNTIARQVIGQPTSLQNLAMVNLFDENTLRRLSESTWKKLWENYLTFGTASAGVLAAVIIVRGIKLIIDTIIHGYALKSVYGWSLHLLGAIWSSVTHLLLHLNNRRESHQKDRAQNTNDEEKNLVDKGVEIPQTKPRTSAPTPTCPHGYVKGEEKRNQTS